MAFKGQARAIAKKICSSFCFRRCASPPFFFVFCRSRVGPDHFWAHIGPCISGVADFHQCPLAAAAGLFSSNEMVHLVSHANSKSKSTNEMADFAPWRLEGMMFTNGHMQSR
jgi:hypothetical protein